MASNAFNPTDNQAIPHEVGILPRRNESDLAELPPSVRQELTIHPVDRVAEAFDLALLPDQIKAAGPNQPQCATG